MVCPITGRFMDHGCCRLDYFHVSPLSSARWLTLHKSIFPAPVMLGLDCNLFGQWYINEYDASRCLKCNWAIVLLWLSWEKYAPASYCLFSLDPTMSQARLCSWPWADRLTSWGCIRLQLPVGLADLIWLPQLTNWITFSLFFCLT